MATSPSSISPVGRKPIDRYSGSGQPSPGTYEIESLVNRPVRRTCSMTCRIAARPIPWLWCRASTMNRQTSTSGRSGIGPNSD